MGIEWWLRDLGEMKWFGRLVWVLRSRGGMVILFWLGGEEATES